MAVGSLCLLTVIHFFDKKKGIDRSLNCNFIKLPHHHITKSPHQHPPFDTQATKVGQARPSTHKPTRSGRHPQITTSPHHHITSHQHSALRHTGHKVGQARPSTHKPTRSGRHPQITTSPHHHISTSAPALRHTGHKGRAGPPFNAQANKVGQASTNHHITTSPHQH